MSKKQNKGFFESVANKQIDVLRKESVKYIHKNLPLNLVPTQANRRARGGGRLRGGVRLRGGTGRTHSSGQIIEGGKVNIYLTQPAPYQPSPYMLPQINPFDIGHQSNIVRRDTLAVPMHTVLRENEMANLSKKIQKKTLVNSGLVTQIGTSLATGAIAGGIEGAVAGTGVASGIGSGIATTALGIAPALIGSTLVAGAVKIGSDVYKKYKDNTRGKKLGGDKKFSKLVEEEKSKQLSWGGRVYGADLRILRERLSEPASVETQTDEAEITEEEELAQQQQLATEARAGAGGGGAGRINMPRRRAPNVKTRKINHSQYGDTIGDVVETFGFVLERTHDPDTIKEKQTQLRGLLSTVTNPESGMSNETINQIIDEKFAPYIQPGQQIDPQTDPGPQTSSTSHSVSTAVKRMRKHLKD